MEMRIDPGRSTVTKKDLPGSLIPQLEGLGEVGNDL